MTLRPIFLATGLLAASAAQAANINWSIGPSFGGANGHQGILTNGSLVEAVNLTGAAGAAMVVDPLGLNISFTTVNHPAFNTSFIDPPNGIGDAAWSQIVSRFEWTSNADVSAPAFLSHLSVGHTYQVQFFAGRSHGCCGNRSQTFGDGNGNFSAPIQFTPGSFVSVVGSFVADAATQHIVFDDSSNNPLLSAYVLRDITVSVPEPGTWALLLAGLASMAGVARRRSA